MKKALILAVVLVCGIARGDTARPATVIAVLPMENRSTNPDAARLIEKLVQERVVRRGWTIASAVEVEKILEEDRVRFLESVDDSTRRKIQAQLGASAILLGSVYEYNGGEEPAVAVSLRVLDVDGHTLWGSATSLRGSDTERVLELGRISDTGKLAEAVVDDVTHGFPRPGSRRTSFRGPSKPVLKRGPRAYASKELEGAQRRVCVLPFDSLAGDAPRVMGDLLTIRMAGSGIFDVIEPAELRAAMREERLRSFRGLTPEQMKALANRVGTSLFLRGSIYEYRDAPARSTSTPPVIDVEFSLVDVNSGRILWSGTSARNGLEYRGLLMRGAVSNVVSLTDRVVTEIVQTARAHRPRGSAESPQPTLKAEIHE